MANRTIQIPFNNSENPNSSFDLLKIEALLERKEIDHNPAELHRVDFFLVILITEGKGYHTIDFTDYTYEAGTLFTIRKNQIHRFHKEYQPKGYLLLFTNEFIISYLEKLEADKSLQLFNDMLASPKTILDREAFQMIVSLIKKIGYEYTDIMDEYSLGIIRSYLHILSSTLYRIKSKENKPLTDKKHLSSFIRFQNLVETHIQKTSRVSDYAQMMAISTKTLNTITKSITNKTAKSFIDEIAIKQIKRLLIHTELSIKEIAIEVGFEEITNFYKYFKKHVQSTPEVFRAAH